MVPKGKRTQSKIEFLTFTYDLYGAVVGFLLKDFGIKAINRDLKTFAYKAKMSTDDGIVFAELCEKYRIDVEADYPMYVLEHFRNCCLRELDNILHNIIDANTIYPNTMYEFNLRRGYQHKAISSAYMLHQLFIIINKLFHPNTEKYMVYVDMVDKEISLLKKWKKSDNKILRALKEKEEKLKTQINQNQINDPVVVSNEPETIITYTSDDKYSYISDDMKINIGIINPISFINNNNYTINSIYFENK